jgi:hypothetical protein
VVKRYGIHAEGITLAEWNGKPDDYLFREAIKQINMMQEQD